MRPAPGRAVRIDLVPIAVKLQHLGRVVVMREWAAAGEVRVAVPLGVLLVCPKRELDKGVRIRADLQNKDLGVGVGLYRQPCEC
jgi:hypothetical protein